MNEGVTLALAVATGLSLGALFFGGLWWTVRKVVTSNWPVLLFLGSLLLRTGIVVAGFYAVSDGHWKRLLACMFGFAVARFIVTRLAGPPLTRYMPPAKEPGHAP